MFSKVTLCQLCLVHQQLAQLKLPKSKSITATATTGLGNTPCISSAKWVQFCVDNPGFPHLYLETVHTDLPQKC